MPVVPNNLYLPPHCHISGIYYDVGTKEDYERRMQLLRAAVAPMLWFDIPRPLFWTKPESGWMMSLFIKEHFDESLSLLDHIKS